LAEGGRHVVDDAYQKVPVPTSGHPVGGVPVHQLDTGDGMVDGSA
jgi:hypothetical protein